MRSLPALLLTMILCTAFTGTASAHTRISFTPDAQHTIQQSAHAKHIMAARSFVITIKNFTGQWTRTNLVLQHGIWLNDNSTLPPEILPKFSTTDEGDPTPSSSTFGGESQGFATGTEGYVDYMNSRGGTMRIYWDDPYVGSNNLVCYMPTGYKADCPSGNAISGNNASATITITRS